MLMLLGGNVVWGGLEYDDCVQTPFEKLLSTLKVIKRKKPIILSISSSQKFANHLEIPRYPQPPSPPPPRL